MKPDYGTRNNQNLKLIVVLARAMGSLDKDLFRGIRESGMTPAQFDVMESLYHIGSLTVNEIIAKTLSSSGNTGVVVDNLIKSGWVRKDSDPNDGRVRRISLTEDGRRKIHDFFPVHVDAIAERFEVLSDEEVDELTALLKKLGKGRKGR